jgi:hypothetical protein
VDEGMELVKTVADLAKDVVKVMENVPYVEGIAGVVSQLIRIRDVQ